MRDTRCSRCAIRDTGYAMSPSPSRIANLTSCYNRCVPAPDESPPDVTVSIVNFNTRDLLRRCLESLYRPNSPAVRKAWDRAGAPLAPGEAEQASFEVMVVDQVSLDRSAEMVAEE